MIVTSLPLVSVEREVEVMTAGAESEIELRLSVVIVGTIVVDNVSLTKKVNDDIYDISWKEKNYEGLRVCCESELGNESEVADGVPGVEVDVELDVEVV